MDKLIVETLPQFDVARLKAVDFTNRTGNEYGVLLDAQKGILGEVAGHSDWVDVTEVAGHRALKGRWVIHTHPDSSALSMQDVAVLGHTGGAGVVALGPDGSVYQATDVTQSAGFALFVMDLGNKAGSALAHLLVDEYGYSPAEGQLVAAHFVNLHVSEKGIYKYTFKLGKDASAAWSKFERDQREGRVHVG